MHVVRHLHPSNTRNHAVRNGRILFDSPTRHRFRNIRGVTSISPADRYFVPVHATICTTSRKGAVAVAVDHPPHQLDPPDFDGSEGRRTSSLDGRGVKSTYSSLSRNLARQRTSIRSTVASLESAGYVSRVVVHDDIDKYSVVMPPSGKTASLKAGRALDRAKPRVLSVHDLERCAFAIQNANPHTSPVPDGRRAA